MLIISRKESVMICIKNLVNSIMLIKGINTKGVFFGVKFIKKMFLLLLILNKNNILIIIKDIFKVNIILVDT